jgi:hypothetical protein
MVGAGTMVVVTGSVAGTITTVDHRTSLSMFLNFHLFIIIFIIYFSICIYIYIFLLVLSQSLSFFLSFFLSFLELSDLFSCLLSYLHPIALVPWNASPFVTHFNMLS